MIGDWVGMLKAVEIPLAKNGRTGLEMGLVWSGTAEVLPCIPGLCLLGLGIYFMKSVR